MSYHHALSTITSTNPDSSFADAASRNATSNNSTRSRAPTFNRYLRQARRGSNASMESMESTESMERSNRSAAPPPSSIADFGTIVQTQEGITPVGTHRPMWTPRARWGTMEASQHKQDEEDSGR